MKAALWLMDRFGVMTALIGDLVEQRRGTDRSVLWLWRQTIAAILQTTLRGVLDQKGIALVTAVTSAFALLVWVESSWAVYLWLSERWMNAWASPGGTWTNGVRVGGFWSRALCVWWELYGGGLSVLWCAGSALIGRVVARRHAMALVVVAVAAQLPLVLWWGVPLWLRVTAYVGLRPVHAWNVRAVAAMILIGMPLSSFVAGLSAAPFHRTDVLEIRRA